MERLTQPLGLLAMGTVASVTAGIAILAFGAPAWILLAVAWGGGALVNAVGAHVKRRLGQR